MFPRLTQTSSLDASAICLEAGGQRGEVPDLDKYIVRKGSEQTGPQQCSPGAGGGVSATCKSWKQTQPLWLVSRGQQRLWLELDPSPAQKPRSSEILESRGR